MEGNQDPNSNAAFSQTSGAQSNPFTSELKGEFSSDFGTNTNAVSQIFKGGGFTGDSKSKLLLAAAAAIVILGGGYYFLGDSMSGDGTEVADEDMPLDEESAEGETKTEEATATDAKPADAAATDPAATATTNAAAPVDAAAAAAPTSTGAITIVAPANGASQSYDETQGVSDFSWEGPADEIVFSRSQTMSPVVKSVKLNGASSFSFENPFPGTWYWQVKNASGASDVSSFTISSPERRSFPVAAPTPGGSIAGNGGVVSWQAGDKIARYSVEISPSGQSFSNPSFRFGTSGTSLSLQGVSPGTYDFRVGAFSEVAGRWEWQVIQNVSVQ